jgi:hypothetical protein
MPDDGDNNTVGELIRALRKIDRSKIVVLQGCDCLNEWDGRVTENDKPNEIVLRIDG